MYPSIAGMNIHSEITAITTLDRGVTAGMSGRVIAMGHDMTGIAMFENGTVVTGLLDGVSVRVARQQRRGRRPGTKVVLTRDISKDIRKGDRGVVVFLGGRFMDRHTVRFFTKTSVANLPVTDLVAVSAPCGSAVRV